VIDLDLFKRVVTARGVSGFEDPVRNVIISELKRLGVEPRVDAMGNIIVEIGFGSAICLACAHMDEVGLLATYIEQDGKIRFRKVGGIDDRVLINQMVEIYDRDSGELVTRGVICVQPPHLQLRRDSQTVPWYELYIDVGLESRSDVESLGLRTPCPVCLEKRFEVLANGKIVVGRGLDDRAGCYTLIKVVEKLVQDPPKDRKIVLAWTVQEEIGLRGAKALSRLYSPNIVIVLDTMSCCNPVITGDAKLGNGPVLRILDNEFICSMTLLRKVLKIAERENIPIQVASAGGTTDALELQELNVPTLPICVLCKYSHTCVEMCNIDDIERWVELTYKVLTSVEI